MKIGELATAAAVSKDTVRHYVELGLLRPSRDHHNGYLLFNNQHLSRLQFIKAARALGLRLSDIELIFADAENACSPCPRVRELISERLAETRTHIHELNRLCDRMADAVAQWDKMPDSVPNGDSVCRLIESQMHADAELSTGEGTPR